MHSTIDGAGRVVIPKSLRDALGLRPGQPLEIVEREGHIEIEPAPIAVRLERRDGVLVAVPEPGGEGGPAPALTAGEVRDTVENLRR